MTAVNFLTKARTAMVAALFVVGAHAMAQPFPTPSSTVCNPDGTVTFLYKNDNARKVAVDVQFAGRHDMTRDAKTGMWTVTLGPAAPDMYPYHFEVDGVSVMDPLCEQYFPNEGFKNSLLEIPGKAPLAHDIRNVPHGVVEYIHYYSNSLGATNNAIVYLPPSYATDENKKYPVFYLISGTTDTEEVYYKVGRMNYILDNLLAEGAAKEMIIVLPYGNPYKLLPPQKSGQMSQMGFGNDVFSNDLVKDLMPYVESHYRTINDRDHRAIGGFSRGGNQGLSCGLLNLDKFSYLCSYSSFTQTNLPGVYDNAADTNAKIHLFWLGIGTDDFLYGTGRDYMEFLDKKGIRSVKEFTTDKFGHTWMNAKFFLDKTFRLLFNPEASAKAMSEGKPAPAATGKEEPFTPGVMARLFPRPIISPDFGEDNVTFRLKAPEARDVSLWMEGFEPFPMTKDEEGVWKVTIEDKAAQVYKYCFVVDGAKVVDPSNMYLSPDKGFKYSVCNNPYNPYSFTTMGDIPHGHVSYDLNLLRGVYVPAADSKEIKHVVLLVSGPDDTFESWFKVGGADAIADKLIAGKQAKPCLLVTGLTDEKQLNLGSPMKVTTLRASDYKTWRDRREALEKTLKNLK
ncbi:MAG: hypothetical protein J5637_01835 [Prevotella sp.]|nr:hypothetical protein [Prevotella sp.]